MHGGHGWTEQGELTEIRRAVAQTASVEEAVMLTRDRFCVDHVTHCTAVAPASPVSIPFVRSTYPPQWIARYLLRSYITVDPVVQVGFRSTRPFAWDELDWNSEAEKALMADALAHGLAERGYAIPVVDRAGRRSLLTLNADMPAPEWADFIDRNLPTLSALAEIIHDKAVSEIAATSGPAPSLSPRETECLLWTARGKEAKAIAAICDLSEYTVRSYLRTARQKLKCRTLSQAVARAMQHGLIHPQDE
ncbi:LuxR family transcriptional regulator [Chelativorans sp. M5D2P16]|uniref:helix-turn-helix transcriptional regulator n=1 Tax=Chelativorans sp. M5D2P16 TaxID=3095678 RepID=UPI002ACA4F5D|nr:LuxR family transcriptional regulator [Chelativorans sp. M5D2P16]MDZ5696978.1 LuxR family transcriptional regulator [Chelativorans sp. M5D2P16]